MDLNYFTNAWSNKAVDPVASQAFWDIRAEDFNKRAYSGEGKERLKKIMSLLVSKGMLTEDAHVLDIGCGPGKYAVEFAKTAKSVTGIDISPNMIKYAEENAVAAGLSNVEFRVMDWEEIDLQSYNWDKKFDLVFAAMSPAINSGAALEKMIKACRGACFLSRFVERKDSVKGQLDKLIRKNSRAGHEKDIYFIFNILWIMGYYPEIAYTDASWEQEMTVEQAEEYYCSYFQMSQTLTPEQRSIIRNHLEKISENGRIKETVNAKIALMTWRV